MKGQVATEYMIIISVALVILVPLTLYINQTLGVTGMIQKCQGHGTLLKN